MWELNEGSGQRKVQMESQHWQGDRQPTHLADFQEFPGNKNVSSGPGLKTPGQVVTQELPQRVIRIVRTPKLLCSGLRGEKSQTEHFSLFSVTINVLGYFLNQNGLFGLILVAGRSKEHGWPPVRHPTLKIPLHDREIEMKVQKGGMWNQMSLSNSFHWNSGNPMEVEAEGLGKQGTWRTQKTSLLEQLSRDHGNCLKQQRRAYKGLHHIPCIYIYCSF